MTTQRNPINPNTIIDLGSALEIIQPQYGRIADSGLFNEQGITAKAPHVQDCGSRCNQND